MKDVLIFVGVVFLGVTVGVLLMAWVIFLLKVFWPL